MRTQYSWNGIWKEVIRVNWIGLAPGFIVRRQSKSGHITGNLTDRGGFGRPYIAQVFPDAQTACNAGLHAGIRHFEILENIPSRNVAIDRTTQN